MPLVRYRWYQISWKSNVKKVREKSRECHNHKPQPFPDLKRKRKPTNLNKHKPDKRTKSTKISSLLPKRGNRNTKRTEKHKNKTIHGKTYNKSPRRINHKATKSKTNTGTTALERSAEQTTGGFKPWLLRQPQGPVDLHWENACHYHNSLSFDRMFLKLAYRHVKSPENRGRVTEKKLFSRLTKFEKNLPKKNESPNFGSTFLKSYACKLKKKLGSIRSSPNVDRKRINAWIETRIKYENQSILMPLLHCGKRCPKWRKDRHLRGFAPRKKRVTIN